MSDTVLYIYKTVNGVACESRHYTNESIYSKGYRRYFYGEDALESAFVYANSRASRFEDYSVESAYGVENPVGEDDE